MLPIKAENKKVQARIDKAREHLNDLCAEMEQLTDIVGESIAMRKWGKEIEIFQGKGGRFEDILGHGSLQGFDGDRRLSNEVPKKFNTNFNP